MLAILSYVLNLVLIAVCAILCMKIARCHEQISDVMREWKATYSKVSKYFRPRCHKCGRFVSKKNNQWLYCPYCGARGNK